MSDTPHVLLLSGSGTFADPWHAFGETSARVAGVLTGDGLRVEVRDDVGDALAALADPASWPDLLVLNVGGTPREGSPVPAPGPAADGFTAYLRGDHPLLAVHAAGTAFDGFDAWEARLGGRWVFGVSVHPDHGLAHVHVPSGRSPITAGLADFDVLDERYTHLPVAPDVVVVAEHEHEGARHPLVWVREAGGARTAYDALGHDARSYDSPERCELLRRTARWVLGR